MKLNVASQIEMLGDLVSPQPEFFLDTEDADKFAAVAHLLPARRVEIVTHAAVVVERVMVRNLPFELVTPVMNGELHNATHRLPVCVFGDN